MRIRPMKKEDRACVLPMVDAFYHSEAASHVVPAACREQVFVDAVGENPHLTGVILEENGTAVGFAYLTFFYACELAGEVVMLEELFVKEAFRGRGIGQDFLNWLYTAYPKAARFRLEIAADNPARHLYERNGFADMDYGQMAFDR